MVRRRLLLIAAALIALITGVAAFVILEARPARVGPTWTNYMRIQDGMKFDDAERILGKATTANEGAEGKQSTNATWVTRDHSVFMICFRADGTVITQWFDSKDVTIIDRFCRLLHL